VVPISVSTVQAVIPLCCITLTSGIWRFIVSHKLQIQIFSPPVFGVMVEGNPLEFINIFGVRNKTVMRLSYVL